MIYGKVVGKGISIAECSGHQECKWRLWGWYNKAFRI